MMWFYDDKPYKGTRRVKQRPQPAYADHIGDTAFFLICVAIAVGLAYLLAPLFQLAAWVKL